MFSVDYTYIPRIDFFVLDTLPGTSLEKTNSSASIGCWLFIALPLGGGISEIFHIYVRMFNAIGIVLLRQSYCDFLNFFVS